MQGFDGNWTGFRYATLTLAALIGASGVFAVSLGSWRAATIAAVTMALTLGLLRHPPRMPAVFAFLFGLAGIANVTAFCLEQLHGEPSLLSQWLPMLMGFAMAPVLAFVLLGPLMPLFVRFRASLVAIMMALGISIIVIFELGHWLGLDVWAHHFPARDFERGMQDLFFSAIGALVSAPIVLWSLGCLRSKQSDPAVRPDLRVVRDAGGSHRFHSVFDRSS